MAPLPRWVRSGDQAISPTAHFTGHVWVHHGLGDPALATPAGRLLHGMSRVVFVPLDALGGPTLEAFLLARHRIIDHLLSEEIEAGRVGQVVELACGMSPRGHRFATAYGDTLTYVEVDLPGMATRKRDALSRIDSLGDRHRVEAADVTSDADLGRVFATLDPEQGTAVITEGLLNYFPTAQVRALWSRVARELRRFPQGIYLSDLHTGASAGLLDQAFAAGLGVFVRGRVHFHFADDGAAEGALVAAGFRSGRLHAPVEYDGVIPGTRARGADRVRVVEARTTAIPGSKSTTGTTT